MQTLHNLIFSAFNKGDTIITELYSVCLNVESGHMKVLKISAPADKQYLKVTF